MSISPVLTNLSPLSTEIEVKHNEAVELLMAAKVPFHIVGSTALKRVFPTVEPSDIDILIPKAMLGVATNIFESRYSSLGQNYMGGFHVSDIRLTWKIDFWGDDIEVYLQNVPLPLLRVSYSPYQDRVKVGPGFQWDLEHKVIALDVTAKGLFSPNLEKKIRNLERWLPNFTVDKTCLAFIKGIAVGKKQQAEG